MPFDDPYAPPREESQSKKKKKKKRRVDFEAEKRSIGVVAALWLCTCGIYHYVWLIRRRAFLDSLSSDRKLGPMPAVIAGALVLSIPIAVVWQDAVVIQSLQTGIGVAAIVVIFRARRMLMDHFGTKRMSIDVNGVATFFLGALYLQYVINAAADLQTARRLRRRRRPSG